MTEEKTAPPDERPATRVAVERVPAFVIVWAADEPDRIGEIALLPDVRMKLGRSSENSVEHLRFLRERPGDLDPRPAIASPKISREQLLVERVADGVLVARGGGPDLSINGAACTSEVVVRPGDTIEIKGQMILFVTERWERAPLLRYGTVDGSFGAPDADGIIGESEAAWKLRDDLAYAREASGHVLITGESGTGKELAARAIHARSRHSSGPYVARNAATFSPGLIDAELFGNLKNFPNAGMPERPGLVGQANGGVLFLDEIGELPVDMHAGLMRVLDDAGEYTRLGEAMPRKSAFRLVGATNRDAIALKHDLLARLLVRVALPSLRERREDVPLLVRAHMLREAQKSPRTAGRFVYEREGRAEVRVDQALMSALVRWPYTTNVREIALLLSYSMAESAGDSLEVPKVVSEAEALLAAQLQSEAMVAETPAERARAVTVTPGELRAALARENGNVSATARVLGVSRSALHRLRKKHGL